MSTATIRPTTTPQQVVGFEEAFRKYFKLRRNNVVSGKIDKPRYRGRWALAQSMADMGFREGVEVGVMYGDSAEMWCSMNPSLHLTCVDPYGHYARLGRRPSHVATFEETSERLSPWNVTMCRQTSLETVGDFVNGSLDFVHIDGDHSFDMAMLDMILWAPKVRKGGLVLVHDYASTNWNTVTQAVNAYLFAHGINKWYVTFDVSPTAFWQQI